MTKIIVLTGPPAGGKTTVCQLFEDVGVPTIGTGDGVREEAGRRYSDPDEDDIWEVAESLREEHGPAGPTTACQELIDEKTEDNNIVVVSDLRHQEEVAWLEDRYGDVLVVRVDTRSPSERVMRYIDREIGKLHDSEPIEPERERELRQELHERELRESPYPRQHLTLLNDNAVRVTELMERIQGLCEFVDPDGEYNGVDG